MKTWSLEEETPLASFLHCWSHAGRLEVVESLLQVLPGRLLTWISNTADGSAEQSGLFSLSPAVNNGHPAPFSAFLVDLFCRPLEKGKGKIQYICSLYMYFFLIRNPLNIAYIQ